MNEVVKVTADHKGIFSALAAAQMEMGPALKDAMNPAFKSKYADLASVMTACLPALNKHGICVMQPTGEDEQGRFVKTILAHTSGETVECRVPLIVSKNDMQGYGSAVTYARRYGLMSMAGIAPDDDDGNAAVKAPPKEERKSVEAEVKHDNAVAQAVAYLEDAGSLSDLASAWSNLPRSVQSDQRVIAAKDARKAKLQSLAESVDEIPY